MIPLEIDVYGILRDLSRWGWRNYKIEIACGFTKGYVAQIKCGNITFLSYQRAARLYNFWCSESEKLALAESPVVRDNEALTMPNSGCDRECTNQT